jgi:hypothetical protein
MASSVKRTVSGVKRMAAAAVPTEPAPKRSRVVNDQRSSISVRHKIDALLKAVQRATVSGLSKAITAAVVPLSLVIQKCGTLASVVHLGDQRAGKRDAHSRHEEYARYLELVKSECLAELHAAEKNPKLDAVRRHVEAVRSKVVELTGVLSELEDAIAMYEKRWPHITKTATTVAAHPAAAAANNKSAPVLRTGVTPAAAASPAATSIAKDQLSMFKQQLATSAGWDRFWRAFAKRERCEWMPAWAAHFRLRHNEDEIDHRGEPLFDEDGFYVGDQSGDDFCIFLHDHPKYDLLQRPMRFQGTEIELPLHGRVMIHNALYAKFFDEYKQSGGYRGPTRGPGETWEITAMRLSAVLESRLNKSKQLTAWRAERDKALDTVTPLPKAVQRLVCVLVPQP